MGKFVLHSKPGYVTTVEDMDGRERDMLFSFAGSSEDGQRITVQQLADALYWCEDQFGPRSGKANPDSPWLYSHGAILFANDLVATAFRLRWC